MPQGGVVTTFSVATSDTWKDKNTGEFKEQTEWHRVVLYQRLAELAGEYLEKGSKVYLEGRLKNRKWQDQHGIERYITEIVASDFQKLSGQQGSENLSKNAKKDIASEAYSKKVERKSSSTDFDQDDDIPF